MSSEAIDLKVIGERLGYLGQLMADLKRLPAATLGEFQADWRNAHTAESLVRRAVEAVLDVARHILSRSFGLGSLEYRQVARLASEKGIIKDPGLGKIFAEIAGFRNRLTHHYEDVTVAELFTIVSRHLGDLETIAGDLAAAAEQLGRPERPAARSDQES